MTPLSVSLIVLSLLTPAGVEEHAILSARDVVEMDHPRADLRIKYGDDPLQFGDLRLPAGPGPHPVAIVLHGGCWLAAYDIVHTGSLSEGLTRAGFATWSLEYRRVGDEGGGWPGTFQDVARGADFLRTLARYHPLDLDKVLTVGHSAGGQLALWLAARAKLDEDDELYTAEPLPVHATLPLAPAPYLAELHEQGVCNNVIDGLMGGSPGDYPERYQEGSPMRLIPLGIPQTVILGAHDTSWRPGGEAYVEAALAAQDDVRRVLAEESGHFEMILPTSSTWPLVEEAARELLERAAASTP